MFNTTEFMPRARPTVISRVSKGGFYVYSPDSIQQIIHGVEEEFKKGYKKPESVPYNKNMARKFPNSQKESCEQRQRKYAQAETSRVSRDKNKFMRVRLEENNEILRSVFGAYISRLVNLECYANEVLMKNGQPPIDWQHVWDDDACSQVDSDNHNDDDDDDAEVNVEQLEDIQDDEKESQSDDSNDSTTDSEYDDRMTMTSMGDENDQCMIDSDETMSENNEATIYECHGNGIYSGDDELQVC